MFHWLTDRLPGGRVVDDPMLPRGVFQLCDSCREQVVPVWETTCARCSGAAPHLVAPTRPGATPPHVATPAVTRPLTLSRSPTPAVPTPVPGPPTTAPVLRAGPTRALVTPAPAPPPPPVAQTQVIPAPPPPPRRGATVIFENDDVPSPPRPAAHGAVAVLTLPPPPEGAPTRWTLTGRSADGRTSIARVVWDGQAWIVHAGDETVLMAAGIALQSGGAPC